MQPYLRALRKRKKLDFGTSRRHRSDVHCCKSSACLCTDHGDKSTKLGCTYVKSQVKSAVGDVGGDQGTHSSCLKCRFRKEERKGGNETPKSHLPRSQRSVCRSRMLLAQQCNAKVGPRKALVVVIIIIALGCIVGLLIDHHGQTARGSGKLVRANVRTQMNSFTSVKEHIRTSASEAANNRQLIPKVLHHVYLDGLDSLHDAEQSSGPQVGQRFPSYNRTLRRSCPLVHHEWQYMFWNYSQAEELIKEQYPWFLDTFQTYETNVQKGAHDRSSQISCWPPSPCICCIAVAKELGQLDLSALWDCKHNTVLQVTP